MDDQLSKLKADALAKKASAEAQQKAADQALQAADQLLQDIDNLEVQRQKKAKADQEAEEANKKRREAAAALAATVRRLQAAFGKPAEAPKKKHGKGGRGKDTEPRESPTNNDGLSDEDRIRRIVEQTISIETFNGQAVAKAIHFGWPYTGAVLQLLSLLPEELRIVHKVGQSDRGTFVRTTLGNQLHESYNDEPNGKAQLNEVCRHMAYLLSVYKVAGVNDKHAIMTDVYTSAIIAYNRTPIHMLENPPEWQADAALNSMRNLLFQLARVVRAGRDNPENVIDMPAPTQATPWECCDCHKSYELQSKLQRHAERNHPAITEIIMRTARIALGIEQAPAAEEPPRAAAG